MNRKMWTQLSLALVILLSISIPAMAATVDVEAVGGAVVFSPSDAQDGMLKVTGNDFLYEIAFAAGETPSFNVADVPADGRYQWEIYFVPATPRGSKDASARGLEADAATGRASGSFAVVNGALVRPNLPEGAIEKATLIEKAQVFATDLIVQGSACVGIDCATSESFGFDTFRLKENNLRIHFDDTSASASFPNNDWRLIANESSNGGANYFGIEDATGNKTPVYIEANSPSNTLRVASEGRIGVQQANPVVGIHHTDGNTPTLRLDQDGSDGFQSQIWDIAGNETNFFVRDVSNSSQLPFRIKPNSGGSQLYIWPNEIGMGTGDANPDANLHVKQDGASFLLENTSDSNHGITLKHAASSNNQWVIQQNASTAGVNAGGLTFTLAGTGSQEMVLETDGDVTITGQLTTGGTTCGGGCDLVFQPEYDLRTIEEHAAYMWENSYLPAVGPTVENEPFNMTEKTTGMLNELEHAHIYIDQLNNTLKELIKRVEELEAQK